MIRELASQIKNYAIMSQFGNGEENNTVTLIPIGYNEIPRITKTLQIDGIVRFFPNGSIYRILVGQTIYSDPKEIENMSKVLGLHKESRAKLNISDKKFDFDTGGFEG